VASIVKTLAWHHSISKMEPSVRKEYARIIPELLREFLFHEQKLTE